MRNITCYLLVACGFVLAAQTASAQAIQSWSGGSQYGSYYGGVPGDVVGYRFQVTTAVSVDSLGVWNGDTVGPGLDSDHEVGIWDDTMTLIASTTVTPTSTVLGDFRYEAIPPVALSVGTVYTIGAVYLGSDSDSYISGASGLVTAPEVTWLNAVYPAATSLGFVFPTLDSGPASQGRLGPNFTMGSGSVGTPFCFGDGSSGVDCPGGPANNSAVGAEEGCLTESGPGWTLTASGAPSVAAPGGFVLSVQPITPGEFGIFVQNTTISAAPAPFYNGLLCLSQDAQLIRHYSPPVVMPTIADAGGVGVNAQPMPDGDFLGQTVPGATIYYQYWGRDNNGPAGTGANFSPGLEVIWMP